MHALFSPLAIAPMIDWTYTHFRVLMRLIVPQALLYTEMLTPGMIAHQPKRALSYLALEQPLAIQLGGADKHALVLSAKKAEEAGFVEINLNLGCPSDRVQAGRFGACLMKDGPLVAECIVAIKEAVTIPVTAKTRIGIDNDDHYDFFSAFVDHVMNAGCDKLIVHARKAWLKGLSPKQNRSIPPLHYDFAYQIKKTLPHTAVVINGNIESIESIKQHMSHVDGVMLGRLACKNPYALSAIHRYFYPDTPHRQASDVFALYLDYLKQQMTLKVPISLLIKPVLNLAHGLPGASYWKAQLNSAQTHKDTRFLDDALAWLKEHESEDSLP